ncbi:ATP-binding protein [Denitrificimonas caeni]|uniref:ATP-binding protein n=1 Tax=Denitrificimonas caeni TaxID=521720 RepID=UPI0003B3958D|nr:ATP-binding protein [Denitrificimonas caeni]
MLDMPLEDTEAQRLAALRNLQILDTEADPAFDNLTQVAASLFNVPMVLVSLVDEHRQWFKSRIGILAPQLPRQDSFCSYAVQSDKLFIVENALLDPRFAHTPFVSGSPHIRFYAGMPIRSEDGFNVGTFCLIGTEPRQLSDIEQHHLILLARQAEQLLYLHYRTIQLALQTQQSTASNARYAAIIESAAAGIVRIDGRGRILQLNDSALRMLGYQPEEVLEKNVKMLMPERWATQHDEYLAAYQTTGEKHVIGIGREVAAQHKDGTQIPVHLAVSEVQHQGDLTASESREFIGILSDLRAVAAAREREQQERSLLQVLHRGLTDYHALLSGNTLWQFLKEALKELTQSEYALIGEVICREGSPALKIHAISDLSWNEPTRQLMQKLRDGEMFLSNPDSMLGQVFAGGQTVLSNNMLDDSRGGALPKGHPVLHRYLGVPIIDRGEVIGMYAIANAQQDYDDVLIDWLKPFTSTCALLINLYRQINEQERFTEELKVARDLAERSSKAKTDFLSSMSHELRTPLNAILGFAQLLGNGKQPLAERQQRQVDQILRSGSHLLNLINEVLDLARIESGHTQVSLEPINLQEVIEETLEIVRALAVNQNIGLQVQLEGTQNCLVEADYTRLKQILINLLSNAIKYNRLAGTVILRCQLRENRVHISVSDTGIGIAAEQMSMLFEPFNRLGAQNSSIEGTGVGLALTRKLARLMQTDIFVESTVGEGSVFCFELPLVSISSARPLDTAAVPESATRESAAKKHQVLYIEDNPENQRLMQDIFSEIATAQLRCVCSAEAGFEIACSEQPHLILLDIDLPGMNGFQAGRMLKNNPLTSKIPLLAISASCSAEDQQQASALGFAGFYSKPFNLHALAEHIQQLLSEQESL